MDLAHSGVKLYREDGRSGVDNSQLSGLMSRSLHPFGKPLCFFIGRDRSALDLSFILHVPGAPLYAPGVSTRRSFGGKQSYLIEFGYPYSSRVWCVVFMYLEGTARNGMYFGGVLRMLYYCWRCVGGRWTNALPENHTLSTPINKHKGEAIGGQVSRGVYRI